MVMRVKSPDNYFFVEMNFEEDYNEFANQDLIHIHKVNTRGRKCETRVHGIPEIFDYKKMLKFWKNVCFASCRTSRPTAASPRTARRARTRGEKTKSSPKTRTANPRKSWWSTETTGRR